MGLIGGTLGYKLLRRLYPAGTGERSDDTPCAAHDRLELLLGADVWDLLRGRSVLDFGCGYGLESIEIARRGARRVIGLDIREHVLAAASAAADRAGVADRCVFTTAADELVDVIVCLDGFEHFADPAGVLRKMREVLREDGRVLISFGPPWYHPLGGHLFSVFPWAHLLFSEGALLRWRSDFKGDGATRFGEVEGGLNGMTVGRFLRLIEGSGFHVESFRARAIRDVNALTHPLVREFFTSSVQCRLTLAPSGSATARGRPGERPRRGLAGPAGRS